MNEMNQALERLRQRFGEQGLTRILQTTAEKVNTQGLSLEVAEKFFLIWGCPELASREGINFLKQKAAQLRAAG